MNSWADERESGFTLIELLVVIIIIGILAAIAIPIFFAQRSKGYDAHAKSDLRTVANVEEIYLNDFDTYGALTDLSTSEDGVKVSHGDTVTVERFDGARSYCLSAQSTGSTHIWYYDSAGGGMQPLGATGCPVTTSGTPGGSLTG